MISGWLAFEHAFLRYTVGILYMPISGIDEDPIPLGDLHDERTSSRKERVDTGRWMIDDLRSAPWLGGRSYLQGNSTRLAFGPHQYHLLTYQSKNILR